MKPAISREDLLKLKFVSGPDISACGTRVAYVRTHIDEKSKEYCSNIFMSNADGSEQRQLTFGKKHDNSPRFSPDGGKIAFVSDRSGDKQVWVLDLVNGGEARQLTELRYGAAGPVWSPDGTMLAFTSRFTHDEDRELLLKVRTDKEKEEENKKKREQPVVVDRLRYKSNDAMGFVDGKTNHIWVIAAEGGAPTCLTDGDYDHNSPSWSPDGTTLVFSANRDRDTDKNPSYADIYTVPSTGGEIRQITNEVGPAGNPKFSPCGQKIAYVGHRAEYLGATLGRVWLVDATGGESVCLTGQFDNTVGDTTGTDSRYGSPGEMLLFSPDGGEIYFLACDQGSAHIFSVPSAGGEVKQVTTGKRHVQGFSPRFAQGRLAFTSASLLHPANVYLLEGEEETKLTDWNAEWLSERELSEPEEFWYKGADGWDIHAWIMKPHGFSTGQKYPLIMQIHGGPHTQYGFSFFHEYQMLAGLGYGVVFTNPRGSHGYGQKFVDAVRGDYGGNDYADLMAGVEHVEKLDWVDADRIGVTGGSYGGFMTNWMVGHTNRFKAAVTQRCISNWMSFYGVSDIGYYFTEYEVGGNPWDNVDMMLKHSPITYVKNMKTPLLIIHSEQDMRCPIEQAEQLYIYLRQLGVQTRLVRFNGANHDLSRNGKPELRLERLKHIADWFAEYL
jgi:dipeptidyl aminopeptidase/acylaminoacyl peptidase